jgi:ketosteroid isomerase-like protein
MTEMTTTSPYQLVRDFLDGISNGDVPDDLLTEDMTAWTTTTADRAPRAKYQGGIRVFASIFSDGPTYTIDSVTAQDDRIAAEVQGRGTLVNGEQFHNTYVFMFTTRDGRVASVAEHFNPDVVREKLIPLFQAAMAKADGQ